jgi:putative transcriptional regulator
MTITHHLDEATMMSFAAGALAEGLSAVAATHAAMCTRCARNIVALEDIGGALLAGLPPIKLERMEPAVAAIARPQHPTQASAPTERLEGPLVRLIGSDLDAVRWRRLGFGVWHHRLSLRSGKGGLGLLKVAPGQAIPEHRHGGAELTLVLRGSFHDATGTYQAGDIADLDQSVEHTPVAGPGAECICLVASERPARFRGLIARLLQPLHGL